MTSWRVIEGDCRDRLAEFEAGSIDAIVTSPPYAEQRKYGGAPADRYAEWIAPSLAEMLRVLSSRGSLMLNLGIVFQRGEEHPYIDDVVRGAREIGWKLLQRWCWYKPNAIPHSHPAFMHVMHEYVLWLAPRVDAYRGYDRDTRRPHSPHSVRRAGQSYMRSKDERYGKRGKGHAVAPGWCAAGDGIRGGGRVDAGRQAHGADADAIRVAVGVADLSDRGARAGSVLRFWDHWHRCATAGPFVRRHRPRPRCRCRGSRPDRRGLASTEHGRGAGDMRRKP